MNAIFNLLRASPDGGRLGPLEERTLSALWRRGSATAQELITRGDIPLAYTTVATTLNRLCKKQLVDRVMEGKLGKISRYRYAPRYSRAELERKVAVDTIRHVLGLGTATSPLLSYLIEAIGESDAKLLDDLTRLVDDKRRQIGRSRRGN